MAYMVSVEIRKQGSIGEFQRMTIGSTTDDTKVIEQKISDICKQSNYESRGYRILRVK